jgi:DNA-directed RNA polymerase alpha subunit
MCRKESAMDNLNKTIDELDMSANCYHRLMSLGVETLGDLVQRTQRDLEAKGFDRWSMKEIQELLNEFGLELRNESETVR